MGPFTVEHYKQGLTMGIGSIIICSIIFQDFFINKFKGYMPPALALVMWAVLCPAYSGMATIIYPIVLFGDVLGIAGYVVISYATYAITGPDFSPSTEKALAMAIIGTAVVAILHLLRVRYPAFDMSGLVAQLLATIAAFLSYWASKRIPPSDHIWHMIVLVFLPLVIGSILSMFIVPTPAGQKCIGLMGQLLEVTAHLQNEMIQKLLLAEKEGKDGENENNTSAVVDMNTVSGNTSVPQEGRYVGIAAELEPVVVPMHKIDIQAWQIAVGINGLLTLSALEIDVYNKQHIFPRSAFRAVLTPIRVMEHLYMTIVNFMGNGKTPSNRPFLLLKNELEELRAAVEMSCKTLKQVIVDGYEYEKGLLECLPRVEAACSALEEQMSENEKAQSGGGAVSDEFLVARELISLVLLAGKEVRRAWEKVPAVIAVRQPAAGAVAASFFAENKEEATSDAKKKALESSAVGSVVAPPQAAAAAKAAATDSFSPPPQPFREVLKSTPSCSSFRQKLYLLSVQTGIHSWHWKIVSQMTLCFAIAATLNVIPAVHTALNDRTYWIIITVLNCSDVTTGGIVDNGLQRIAATVMGSGGIALLSGLSYLANGSSYIGSSVAKKLTESAIVTLWLATMKLFNSRYSPRLRKLFLLATFIVPLISLMDAPGEDVWVTIGYRIANTLIGVGVYTFASMVSFPVTAGDHIKEKTADCLHQVANMVEGIAALPLSVPPPSLESTSATKKKRGCCFGIRRRKKNSSSSSSCKEEDLEAAAACVLEDVPEIPTESGRGGGGGGGEVKIEEGQQLQEDDAGSAAAKAIIANGIQKADTSLLNIINLRNVVDKEYLVSKIYYKCVRKMESSSSASSLLPLSSSQKSNDIEPEDHRLAQQLDHEQQQQQQQQQTKKKVIFGDLPSCGLKMNLKAPMHVYHLDQLISHLKHNIVYSNIALLVRERLRSQSVFTKNPEIGIASKAFAQQTAECLKALRLSVLGLLQPKDALTTVLNLRSMASDIAQLCNTSEHFGFEETTVIHMMLVTCQNIELLYRATDRALVTRDEPGVVSITDQELGDQSGELMLSLLNVEATATAVQAVTVEEASVAASDDRKGGAGKTRDGVKELGGMLNTSTI